MKQLALMIDLERCTGCKSCEAACKQTNALGPNSYRNRVMWFDEQQEPVKQVTNNQYSTNQQPEQNESAPRLDFLTVTCQQCERPACLRACPVTPKAISKDPETGVVSINEDRCTGCGECALACPYGAIGYNAEKHHAVKCDLCADRRVKGSGPACAEVCPTRAITFGARDDLLTQATSDDREVLDTDHFLQKPATVYLRRLKDHSKPLENLKNNQASSKRSENFPTPAVMKDHKVRRHLSASLAVGSYRKSDKMKPSDSNVKVVPGGCNICFNGCPVKYHVQGNSVVNVYGNMDDPVFQGRVCPKSQMTLQLYNNPHRLTQPQKRTGKRGSGEFISISWEQALDEISSKLTEVRDKFGSEALAIHSGSRTGVLNLIGAIPLFSRLWGTKNVATTEPYCDIAKGIALRMTQGMSMMASVYTEDDIGKADLYVYIGDNQAETRPVNFGLLNDWRLKRKARMIVVDPRLTVTAAKADEWLGIRSGTDMALGLGIIHYLFSHDLYDTTFCDRWVVGWQEWRDFIFEREYDLDWAAHLTDIEAEKIAELAKSIAAAKGCMIFVSRGINQHSNAAQTNRVFMFLAAITGNWGRKSGGYFNVSSEIDWGVFPIPEDRTPKTRAPIGRNPSSWIEAMKGNGAYPIRALITSNNPLAQWPDQNKAREAIEALDLVVHMELFKNATSNYADYILPMASGIEKGGTTRFAEDRRIVWNDRLIDPPGEAKSDHWFWIELGKRFGFSDILKEDYKQPRKLWDEVIVTNTPALKGANTSELLKTPNRTARLPVVKAGEADPSYITDLDREFPDGGYSYPTPSGKLEFWTEQLESKFQTLGFSALPEFYSESEQLIDMPYLKFKTKSEVTPFIPNEPLIYSAHITNEPKPKTKKNSTFDTELVTGRPPAPHFHSWTHYFWQAQEMWPELYCQIHPEKAKGLNIEDGDQVNIETINGKITARAWLRRGIRKTSVFVPIGWDEQQPFHPATSVNYLTGIKLDPISQQANLKTHLCRVTKVL
ncbi:MAG: molybdopterin-dependent oxidoreductase [Oceanospirillaceae bacterium]